MLIINFHLTFRGLSYKGYSANSDVTVPRGTKRRRLQTGQFHTQTMTDDEQTEATSEPTETADMKVLCVFMHGYLFTLLSN